MADEDNFDIDIYGDGEGMDEDSKEFYKQENQKTIALREQQQAEQRTKKEQDEPLLSISEQVDGAQDNTERSSDKLGSKLKPQQGLKRKGDSDERRIDAGATHALMISDLHWWTTEDDIRGWANEADAEDELRDITFSEHKVNGKSKGQAFVEFSSPQASTATKRKIESLSSGPNNSSRKFSVVFTNASSNPFKTLPKDAPARTKDDRSQRSTSSSYSTPTHHNNNYNSNNSFRGGRGGGFGGRGGYNQNYNNNHNNNRNFSGSGNMGGFNNGPGFQGGMPMMNNFNNFGGRGTMMGSNMRGNMGGMRGRGAMPNNMMPMGMMGMGMGMGMNPMMAGMGPQGFGGTGPQTNSGMFGQNANHNMNGADWGHGAKRQRQD